MPILEPKTVTKLWGQEVWIDNSPLYCGKLLIINPGYESSLHYHPRKTETFFIQDGHVLLEVGEPLTEVELRKWDVYRIEPGTPHRFRALDNKVAVITEFSTEHSDEDVVRITPSRAIINSA